MAHAVPSHARPVRSEDPSLSDEANRMLTKELREAVGRDIVRVPDDVPEHARERHGTHRRALTLLATNRGLIGIAFLTLVVVGAVVSVTTGSWWLLAAAVGVHALATLTVVGASIQLMSETEHVSPPLAARLEDEGVAEPDKLFTELVEEFTEAEEHPGAAAR